jgi:hypothetical protein
MTEDLHSPTTAGPTPETAAPVSTGVAAAMEPATTPAAEPSHGGRAAAVQEQAQHVQAQVQAQVAEKPEILVGAAFAGGFLAAFILKRLGG